MEKLSVDQNVFMILNCLKNELNEHHLDEEAYKWYLELRQYGSVPHSGFGLGTRKNCCLD